MATPAHCAYCFEILIADIEDREPLGFRQLLYSWAQYEARSKSKATETEDDDDDDSKVHDTDDQEEDSEMDGVEESDEDEEGEDDEPQQELAQPTP